MPDPRGSAEFIEHPGGRLRMQLDRWWSDAPRALVCMANPSSAGADRNDPTIWRLLDLVRAMPEVGGFTVVNWEPYIASSPAALHKWRTEMVAGSERAYAAIQMRNLARIRSLSERAPIRFVAWGNLVPQVPHTTLVLDALSLSGAVPLHAFWLTRGGVPMHPMARGRNLIPTGAPPVLWRSARRSADAA